MLFFSDGRAAAYPPLPCRASPPQAGRSAASWVGPLIPRRVQTAPSTGSPDADFGSISPLEGEMNGRTEGGGGGRVLTHTRWSFSLRRTSIHSDRNTVILGLVPSRFTHLARPRRQLPITPDIGVEKPSQSSRLRHPGPRAGIHSSASKRPFGSEQNRRWQSATATSPSIWNGSRLGGRDDEVVVLPPILRRRSAAPTADRSAGARWVNAVGLVPRIYRLGRTEAFFPHQRAVSNFVAGAAVDPRDKPKDDAAVGLGCRLHWQSEP